LCVISSKITPLGCEIWWNSEIHEYH